MDITYKLPHPIRIKCTNTSEEKSATLDKLYDSIFEPLNIESYSIDALTNIAIKKIPQLFDIYRNQCATDHMAAITLSSTLFPYKFRKQDGNILTTSNIIDNLLEQTEIGDDIPVSYLRPPFKNCYIEFTEDRSSSLKVYNEQTHEHTLEGVYIAETHIEPNTKEMERYTSNNLVDTSKPLRILDLMFTGSPIGKSNHEDDALRIQGFYIQDTTLTIKEALIKVENQYGADEDFTGDLNYLSDTLNHMAKVLLFINCKQYRDEAFNERKEMRKKSTHSKHWEKSKNLKTKFAKLMTASLSNLRTT
ncbi:hypothetical protein [Pseudomonas cichorii]|uniref:hypothetical protein n=1 Tax=Pseudomonas cichorii TaxID=36746 RepID=UPI001C89D6D0|nr:hypothetical protein [Pseudomonas cichorii]MBX8498207.1 hypothetical protein [Pseudomonas cichorii]